MILIIKHIDIEGPGTIAGYFKRHEIPYRIIELAQGAALPDDFSGLTGIVILGGPMNVYEEEQYPWLTDEDGFIRRALQMDIPMLGICLGSQLIAKALGAKVRKAPVKELGWQKIALTDEGRHDPLFRGVEAQPEIFQWHEDTFAIPAGAVHLASSKDCPNQAYRFGRDVYGLQFHVEVNEELIASWIEKYFSVAVAADHPQGKEMLATHRQIQKKFNAQADTIYQNFTGIISSVKTDVKNRISTN